MEHKHKTAKIIAVAKYRDPLYGPKIQFKVFTNQGWSYHSYAHTEAEAIKEFKKIQQKSKRFASVTLESPPKKANWEYSKVRKIKTSSPLRKLREVKVSHCM